MNLASFSIPTALLAVMFLSVQSTPAVAAGEWVYIEVDEQGQSTLHRIPPTDLTYPPLGSPTPVINQDKGQQNEGVMIAPDTQFTYYGQAHVIITQMPEPEPLPEE